MEERNVMFKFLYGSQNYGLSVPESDEDWFVVCFPTRENLFSGKEVTGHNEEKHETYWDIRKLFNLVLKGNFNALELLFSTEIDYDEDNPELILYLDLLKILAKIVARKRKYPFYHSLYGMAQNTRYRWEKAETEEQKRKFAARYNWMVEFLDNFQQNGYNLNEDAFRGGWIKFSQKIRWGEAEVDMAKLKERMRFLEAYYDSDVPPDYFTEQYQNQFKELFFSQIGKWKY